MHTQAQQPHQLSCCWAETGTALSYLPVGWGELIRFMFLCLHAHSNLIIFLAVEHLHALLFHDQLAVGWGGWGGVGGGVGWDDNVHVPMHTQAQQPHHLSSRRAETGTALSWSVTGGVGWVNKVHVPMHTDAQQPHHLSCCRALTRTALSWSVTKLPHSKSQDFSPSLRNMYLLLTWGLSPRYTYKYYIDTALWTASANNIKSHQLKSKSQHAEIVDTHWWKNRPGPLFSSLYFVSGWMESPPLELTCHLFPPSNPIIWSIHLNGCGIFEGFTCVIQKISIQKQPVNITLMYVNNLTTQFSK